MLSDGSSRKGARRAPARPAGVRARRLQPAGRGYDRLLAILDLAASEGGTWTGSEIGRRLGVPRSSAFVLLQHLVARGFLLLDPRTRRYSAGPGLVGLACRVLGGPRLLPVARPHLEALSVETSEDTYLAIRHGTEFIYVDRVEGVQSVQLNLRLGAPRPLHSTAPGKLFLAFGPPELLGRVVAEHGLPPVTPATITDLGQFRAELEQIRLQGYSYSAEENVEGIHAFAAPVRDVTGHVVAAVNIPTLRARAHARQAFLVDRLLRAAARIGEALGAPPPGGGGR